jgi:L-serine dehydratase
MERLSIFDIYKIGVGPSSSHTLGPWKAGRQFAKRLQNEVVVGVEVHLFGSLSKTGIGHGTDIAVMLGLEDFDPERIDTNRIDEYIQQIKTYQKIRIGNQEVPFSPTKDIYFQQYSLPFHPNALTFRARTANDQEIEETYYSVGGGFIQKEGGMDASAHDIHLPYPIDRGAELIEYTQKTGKKIWEVVYENELYFNKPDYIRERIATIWDTMVDCMYRGCHKEGILPGGLNVRRRAKKLNQKLLNGLEANSLNEWIDAVRSADKGFSSINQWVSAFALAVNEENASLGRVVTSPTNGAAGVIPAVLMYHFCFCDCMEEEADIMKFMLTSGEVGCLFKKGATISAAQGGCQAEIGVSSAMAAAGLTELNGGTPTQVLMAAEIAMEHHLGLTCDPVGGLVQVPCIERNTMGAIKAITASNLALSSDPDTAVVQLDTVIKAMWDTALDMHDKYKETSEGGLAFHLPVVIPEC